MNTEWQQERSCRREKNKGGETRTNEDQTRTTARKRTEAGEARSRGSQAGRGGEVVVAGNLELVVLPVLLGDLDVALGILEVLGALQQGLDDSQQAGAGFDLHRLAVKGHGMALEGLGDGDGGLTAHAGLVQGGAQGAVGGQDPDDVTLAPVLRAVRGVGCGGREAGQRTA